MMSLSIVIRADASVAIGTGHVMRCMALAFALRARGHRVSFLQAETTPALSACLQAAEMPIELMSVVPGSLEDARLTTEAACRKKACWVVGDSYAFKEDWQQLIKDAGYSLLLLDDYGHAGRYHADLILNQNLPAHAGLYPRRASWTKLLLGPRYALLRPEFLKRIERPVVRAPNTQRVLVTLGGSDPDNITSRVLKGLETLPNAEVVVVVGGSNPHREQLMGMLADRPKWRLVVNATEMAELMTWADVAVSAAGSTAWEIALLGLPSVMLVMAPNQADIAPALERAGVAVCLGQGQEIQPEILAAAVSRLLTDPAGRAKMGTRAAALVDGLGQGRVATRLQAAQLKTRRVVREDSRWLWDLANDPVVRASAFNSAPITWETHEAWFKGKLCSPNSAIFLGLDSDDVPIGQVRFDWDESGRAEVDISVVATRRGGGWGGALILRAAAEAFACTAIRQIDAWVKPENTASARVFENADFDAKGLSVTQGHRASKFTLIKTHE